MATETYSIFTTSKIGANKPMREIQATRENVQDVWDSVECGVCFRWMPFGYMQVAQKGVDGFIDRKVIP